MELLAGALDGGGELLGGHGVGALHLDGLGFVIGVGVGHAATLSNAVSTVASQWPHIRPKS